MSLDRGDRWEEGPALCSTARGWTVVQGQGEVLAHFFTSYEYYYTVKYIFSRQT